MTQLPVDNTLRGVNVCFTCNNPELPPDAFLQLFERSAPCTFVVFQKEVGENGTPHYQGYAEFSRAIRWSFMRRLVGQPVHCERRRGTAEEAVAYCQKDDTRVDGPFEWGTRKDPRPGTRNDLLGFVSAVREGKSFIELLDVYPDVLAKHPHFRDRIRQALRPPPTERSVVLYYGPPGTGKTKAVYDEFPDVYSSPLMGRGFWLDGYDGDPVALLDDFSGARSHISRPELLRLLDRYPVKVPYKGGFVQWTPKTIIATTNYHPSEWYDWKDSTQWTALSRRFTGVFLFKDSGKTELLPDTDAWNVFWRKPVVPDVTPFGTMRQRIVRAHFDGMF